MKLELKHLAPYLPYGLKMQKWWHSHGTDKLTMDVVEFKGILNKDYYIEIHSTFTGYSNDLCRFKPILRPLSDLKKEIEVDNKKFIPIIELLKIKYSDYYKENIGNKYEEIEVSKNSYPKAWFKYSAPHEIFIPLYNFDKLEYWIVEKLFEWHFDYFGLIEKDLALNLNNFEKVECGGKNI